jgi:superfamily II DNA or RNA helicase
VTAATPGALVRYREREWVVLPSDDPDLVLLRPIGGGDREVAGVVRPLADLLGATLPYERIESATFPLPDATSGRDHEAVRLLMDSARLLLRDGAAPFRSLGRLSVRPRPYQFVPLVMALRLPAARLLIADDVGVGKTIEAGLVARELLDRGRARRLAVLCPPYLCDQWQEELASKFNIEAVVIRAGTVARLERIAPQDRSIFEHFRHFVASIDTIKTDHYKASFLQHCPDLVIVDEAHGAAEPPAGRGGGGQQLRHALLRKVAQSPQRHMLLLTATPHSGVESSFQSLLALLKPELGERSISELDDAGLAGVAKYFVQRRRADVRDWMGEKTPFPVRDTAGAEQPYQFTSAYRGFFEAVYDYAGEMVRSAETLSGWRKRMRFWTALALLRAVSSSPAAAQVSLLKRAQGEASAEASDPDSDALDADFEPLVGDPSEEEAPSDAPPTAVFDAQETDAAWGQADRGRLRAFAAKAAALRGPADPKLQKGIAVVADLLSSGYQPIVWCRFIATADYVAEELGRALAPRFPGLRAVAVTGALAEDERRLKVTSLEESPYRVLVATDCLSEGINLQQAFSAAVHYDLPWNPNRLEQREGRVDRFGQPKTTVKAVMLYGQDNPVDGAVLQVLLRKARQIFEQLGVYVPIPMDSQGIMLAVIQSLFGSDVTARGQISLFNVERETADLSKLIDAEWGAAADREKESRTRFAQRAIRPEEVQQALGETDRVLGDPGDVRRFVTGAAARLPFNLVARPGDRFDLQPSSLPEAVRARLGGVSPSLPVTFTSPTPPGLAFVGRNHPLVEGLAEHFMDEAFHPIREDGPVARCGAIRTARVTRRTAIFLLRCRYLVRERAAAGEGRGEDKGEGRGENRGEETSPLPGDGALLAEETVAWGLAGFHPQVTDVGPDEAARLLDEAAPAGNVSANEKREVIEETLAWWPELEDRLAALLQNRADALADSHARAGRLLGAARPAIQPQLPPDLLGVSVLLPARPGETAR